MMSFKYDNFRFYLAVVTEKKTVSYLCARILSDKSPFSLAIVIFEK